MAVPLGTSFIVAAGNFHPANFTSEGFAPLGAKGVLPRAILGSVAIGAVIYVLLQVVFIAALPHRTFAHGWADLDFPGIDGPWAGLTTLVGLGRLSVVLYLDSAVSPGGTGLIYTSATFRWSASSPRPASWWWTCLRTDPWSPQYPNGHKIRS